MFRTTCLVIAVTLAGSGVAPGAGFEILAPHRAVYEVKLERAEARSGITSMSGRIVYEIKGNECEGVAVRFRFVTRVGTGSDQYVTDQQTATFESPDGKELSFLTKSFVNQNADQAVQGNAVRQGDRLEVKLASPQKRQLEFDDAVFTSAHLVELIERARAGDVFLQRDIFDGSGDADKVVASTSVIGKPRVLPERLEDEEPAEFERLNGLQAWPVTVSYFDKKPGQASDSLPVYEVSFLLYENGVARQLLMRYPDYSLKASLSEIEFFDNNSCQIEN